MDLSGAVNMGVSQMTMWCGMCNSNPAIGNLEVEHEEHELPTLPVCEECLRSLAETQFIPGWTDEYDELDLSGLVW